MGTFSSVGIVGLGVIGGSIGLGVKRRGLAGRVIGLARSGATARKALAAGVIDEAAEDFSALVAAVELVVLAAPVSANLAYAALLCAQRPSVFFTDAGSTKAEICVEVDALLGPMHNFVGAHPMAGSERTGLAHASADLFEGRVVFLSATGKSSPEAAGRIGQFWQGLGGLTAQVDPVRHDRLVACTSHLPHLVAFALSAAVGSAAQEPDFRKAIGKGFLDTTRIAASSDEVWADIFMSNSGNLLAALEKFKIALGDIERFIAHGDTRGLAASLAAAAALRWEMGEHGQKTGHEKNRKGGG